MILPLNYPADTHYLFIGKAHRDYVDVQEIYLVALSDHFISMDFSSFIQCSQYAHNDFAVNIKVT